MFYFPKSNQLHIIQIKSCLACFAKPQRANIMSFIKEKILKNEEGGNFKFKGINLPRYLRTSCELVGAGLNDLTHDDVWRLYQNQAIVYRSGWIYEQL